MPRPKPVDGQRCWCVEYCSNMPLNECGDAEIDQATYIRKSFPTIEQARAHAKLVFPKSVLGVVEIDELRFDAEYYDVGFGQWEAVGETEFYEGEDAPALTKPEEPCSIQQKEKEAVEEKAVKPKRAKRPRRK